MRRSVRTVVVLAALLCVAGTVGPAVQPAGASGTGVPTGVHAGSAGSTGAETATPNATPSIVALHPSPRTAGDDGEAVVLRFPEPTSADGWRLVDDASHRAALPNRSLSGTVVLSPEPDAASRHADRRVLALDGQLRLADDGDAVALRRPDGRVVDSASYDRARDGARYERVDGRGALADAVGASTDVRRAATDIGWRWRDPRATAFSPASADPGRATAFVLPDAPSVPVETLSNASDRILLGAYTLTSERVVDALLAASEAGVDVRVLAEGQPVGGTSRAQVAALDRLAAGNVTVTVLAGSDGRYATHHAKYAVVDETVLVLTENWKPAGVGGRSSRGWGVRLRDADLAAHLADVFHADASGPGAASWSAYRSRVDPVAPDRAAGSYPRRIDPASVPVERTRLLVAPDNAESELSALLRSAEDSILLQQVAIDRDDPLLAATIAAAEEGATVRILLSSAWYVAEENRRLAADLRRLAERRDLPLAVELLEPGGAFAKSHVKGAVVDDRHVVLGSLNWNPTALRENREVVVVLEGEAVAGYYREAFEADRAGGGAGRPADRRLPAGLAAAVALAWLALATVLAGRVRWLPERA